MALKQAFSATDGVTDLLYVATNIDISTSPVPDAFITDTTGLMVPVQPQSLDQAFGFGSFYPFSTQFTQYYDQVANVWRDGNIVPANVRADVLIQLEAIQLYQAAFVTYMYLYNIQRDVQWRKTIAQALITACA